MHTTEAPPPPSPAADVLNHRLDTLHGDVGEIKTALRELAAAVVRLALVEERQAQAAAAQERAFTALERIEARLTVLEQQAPAATRAAAWMDRAMWAAAAAACMYIAKRAGLI
jgi:hypothetical protein